MPGILPMKVIKVGSSSQSRIAQACDRCRSKKIRCDGYRPTCTQCANVGFECKTSDKLSRRAFPRGYTESLEERVRALESEVREFKDLLDAKDEKIDMLSKMNSSQSPHRNGSPRRPSCNSASNDRTNSQGSGQQEKDEHFKLQQSPDLVEGDDTDAYFVGASSTRGFIDSLKRKLGDRGKQCSDLKTENFFPSPSKTPSPPAHAPVAAPSQISPDPDGWTAPPRLISDQMVNVYFQEWATLFPVLHRPTFLSLYERYVTNSDNVEDKRSLAQLNLIFCIAALSNENRVSYDTTICEKQSRWALDSFIGETSLSNLQCLLLAQIHCIQKGDANGLLHYRSLAVGVSQRLGLHLSQKRFALGALTVETRKKVFWTLYTLDCFSAAFLGLPKILNEEDIHCEYPVDADDEYVTEKGFQPTLPGESTKLSSALALFKGVRVLGRVLAVNYPTTDTHELSLRSVAELEEDLEAWSSNLPPHLRLEFSQDKPSTNVISSRCPLLSLTYNYIRVLIHRPAVCANLGSKASSSGVAFASANKRIIQVIQLLDERGLSFSHCLNKNELLLLSGFGLIFQSLELDKGGRLIKDSQKLVSNVTMMLESRSAPGATEFKNVSTSILFGRDSPSSDDQRTRKKSSSTGTEEPSSSSNHGQLADLASRYTLISTSNQSKQKPEKDGRKGSGNSPADKASRRQSEKSLRPLAPSTSQKPTASPMSTDTPASNNSSNKNSPKQSRSKTTSLPAGAPNLDYFSFPNDPSPHPLQRKAPTTNDPIVWERLLNTLGNSPYQSEESMYDWPSTDHAFLSPADAELPNGQNGSHLDPNWSNNNTWNSTEFSSVEMAQDGADGAFRGVMIPHFTPETFSPAGGGEFDALQNDGTN